MESPSSRRQPRSSSALAVTLALSAAAPTNAQCLVDKLRAGGWTTMIRPGLAVSGSTALVGQPDALLPGSTSGAVYVYDETPEGWVESQVLSVFDPIVGDFDDPTIHGDTAMIAKSGGGHGRIYVYERASAGSGPSPARSRTRCSGRRPDSPRPWRSTTTA